MSIILPDYCPRGRKNCNAYSQIISDDEKSFFCCGVHDGSISQVLADKWTLCFKNDTIDQISLSDKRDLIHQAAVITQALAAIEELEEQEKAGNK